MNITDMTTEELKIAWFDQFMLKSQAEQNLNNINQVMSSRNVTRPPAPEVPSDEAAAD